MATPTIPNGKEHFFPILYEGNGGGQRVGKFVPFTDSGTITNSCLFEASDNDYLSKTFSSDGNRKKFTISVWFKRTILGGQNFITSTGASSSNRLQISIESDNTVNVEAKTSGSDDLYLRTSRSFEDTSKWYHLLLAVDSTATSGADSEKAKLYIDGDLVTSFQSTAKYPGDNDNLQWNAGQEHMIGKRTYSSNYFDGYLAEFNNVDGSALTPSTFGVTDTSSGRWVPKTLSGITYGTNGFRLTFQNNDAVANLGYDYQTSDRSGTPNDFTVYNLATTNQTTDSPTQNFATLQGTGGTLSEGNLKLVTGNSERGHHNSTLKPKSGKYYAEFTCNAMGRSEVGVVSTLNVPYSSNTTRLPTTSDESVAGYMYYGYNGRVYYDSSNNYDITYATYTTNDIISIALDLDNHTVQFFKTAYDSSSSSYGSRVSQGTIQLPNSNYTFCMGDGAAGYGGGWTANFGQRSFQHTAPTGFVALQQDNLPEASEGVSGLVWIKNRDATDSHQLYDSSRGPQIDLNPDGNAAETTTPDGLQKFLKGGFQIEDAESVNTSGESYASWNWVANGGTTSVNSDGSNGATLESVIQVNQNAGFSIVTWTGNATVGAKIAHGLSQKPEWFILKPRSMTGNHYVYHEKIGANYFLYLNLGNARYTGVTTPWNDTEPTDQIITLMGSGYGSNNSGQEYIAYCWHSVEGFSKFGSYQGSSDGAFIYTGFKPALVIIKCYTNASTDWVMYDNLRNPFNSGTSSNTLYPNRNYIEGSAGGLDFLSNGFKLLSTNGFNNNSSRSYVYMAFAEHPFVGDGTSPVTAR